MAKLLLLLSLLPDCQSASAQSLGGGILRGVVTDASNAPVPAAEVALTNPLTGYSRQVRTAQDGAFTVTNIPPNTYRLRIDLAGFQPYNTGLAIRTAVPLSLRIRLEIAREHTSVTVEGAPPDILDNKTSSGNTVDSRMLDLLPSLTPDSALNDAIIYTTPGVAADSNGFFHPLGDHAQVSYVIDGQPISDQRNKVFSTSIPANAIQSMEVISGSPAAEYGDKTSLVIQATTRSGLGQKPTGSLAASYGSFGTIGEEATLALGAARFGNFLAVNSERTGRFLDTPEFRPIHDAGNTGTIWDRIDLQPNGRDAFHLNLMAARNWFQVPNTYAQPRQDQRQKVLSFSVSPGYQHTIGSRTLLGVNTFARRDQVDYYPSRNLLDDSPATLAQSRSLSNFGARFDLSRVDGRHNWKIGATAMQTRLDEEFSLGITHSTHNSPCLSDGSPAMSAASPSSCAALGLEPNPDFLSTLMPYDLTRGGHLYRFRGDANINQLAFFGQDALTLGGLTVSVGLRFDRYRGLAGGSRFQPRAAFSYLLKPTRTVIRGGYSHTMETPTNENLVASSSTGPGGLASNLFQDSAEQRPLVPGIRNQFDAGIQQALSRFLLLDVSYFRKYTRNAFDFDALFSTPITFPIGWKQSKLDGVAARISTIDLRGLRVYATMGHANARFFGPETGGIIFNSSLTASAYRQDHDQVYQQNVNLRYQRTGSGWWADFMWRYDSGLVVGAVNNMADALALTADQQAVIGLYCGAERATLSHRISKCDSGTYGAERIHILPPGSENDDHNPPRTMSRHIFNLGVGIENIFRAERLRTTARFTILNVANQASLYNFLSPFSGTHWVAPRTFVAQLGWAF